MLDSADVTPIDGRIARSRRTRAAIVDALIALLEEGSVQPTVEEIAARARVAPRTVFQHYADREALFAAVGDRRAPRIAAVMDEIPADGPLDVRLDALVDQRARVYELIAPVRRAALLMEPFSETAHASVEGYRELKRVQVAKIFAGEIVARPPGEREILQAALCAAASWSAWDALRTQQRLDIAQASAAMRRMLHALLTAG